MRIENNKLDLYLVPLINIVVGILIIIFKGEVIRWAALAVGVFFVVLASLSLVQDLKLDNNRNVGIDIAIILIGALIIVFAGAFASAIRIISGIVLIAYGIIKFLAVFETLPKDVKIILLIEMILYIAVGILLFLDKSVLYYIIGGLLVFNGVVDILYSRAESKNINKNLKHADAIDVEVSEKQD